MPDWTTLCSDGRERKVFSAAAYRAEEPYEYRMCAEKKTVLKKYVFRGHWTDSYWRRCFPLRRICGWILQRSYVFGKQFFARSVSCSAPLSAYPKNAVWWMVRKKRDAQRYLSDSCCRRRFPSRCICGGFLRYADSDVQLNSAWSVSCSAPFSAYLRYAERKTVLKKRAVRAHLNDSCCRRHFQHHSGRKNCRIAKNMDAHDNCSECCRNRD